MRNEFVQALTMTLSIFLLGDITRTNIFHQDFPREFVELKLLYEYYPNRMKNKSNRPLQGYFVNFLSD